MEMPKIMYVHIDDAGYGGTTYIANTDFRGFPDYMIDKKVGVYELREIRKFSNLTGRSCRAWEMSVQSNQREGGAKGRKMNGKKSKELRKMARKSGFPGGQVYKTLPKGTKVLDKNTYRAFYKYLKKLYRRSKKRGITPKLTDTMVLQESQIAG